MHQPHIFITGPPGCGKTTVIQRVIQSISSARLAGFYTKEIREQGRRTGFEMIGLRTGTRMLLASEHSQSDLRLRRYGIELAGLNEIVEQELRDVSVPQLFVIDEIGKIELYSQLFVDTVRAILNGTVPVLGTVAIRGEGLIQEVKERTDVDVVKATPTNRDELPNEIAARLFPSTEF